MSEKTWANSPIHKMIRDAGVDDGSLLAGDTCSHDYVNFKRKGRARYHCPKCDADITLECVLLAESLLEETENKTEQP